jgi:polysaccharide export outer membrane protein
MRSLVFAPLVLSACLTTTASAQVKSVSAANPQSSSTIATPLRRTETFTAVTDSARKTAAKVAVTAASTQVYFVGPGDVLDVQLSNYPSRNSTLFTVLPEGVLEYPLAGSPIVVCGMTTVQIATLLQQRIKIFDNPKVKVDVRDYASHTVTIIGFVSAPGTKILRREAVPLYTMLAEALVLPDAARATITRQGAPPINVDLKDARLSAALVVPGDVIKVTGVAPVQFFFVGGEIRSPGQKPFHAGLTLTQAILASGGTKASGDLKVKVSRQGTDGTLATQEFNLRKIQTGKTPDPVLRSGDRLEVTTTN